MINKEAVIMAVRMLEDEKQISPAVTFEALKEGLIRAYHKEVDPAANVEVDINEESGEIKVYNVKIVRATEAEIEDDMTELTEAQVKELGGTATAGQTYRVEFDFTKDFSRLGTQVVAQTLKQKLKEKEKENIQAEYEEKIGDIVLAQVESITRAGVLFSINNIPAFMPFKEGIFGEELQPATNVKVAITNVTLESRGAQILVSRRSAAFVKVAMMQEVPEIAEGIIEILHIQREPGIRSKVVVKSHDPSIDAIGTCVGKGGQRIKYVENAITKGERVEIANWSDDVVDLLKSIFSPTPLISVNNTDYMVEVIVPDEKYSLALTSKALNGKLASSILEKKVWIYKESEIDGDKVKNFDNTGYTMPVAPTKSVSEEQIINAEPALEINVADFTDVETENSPAEIKDENEFTFDKGAVAEEEYKEEFDFDNQEDFSDEEFNDYDDDDMYDKS